MGPTFWRLDMLEFKHPFTKLYTLLLWDGLLPLSNFSSFTLGSPHLLLLDLPKTGSRRKKCKQVLELTNWRWDLRPEMQVPISSHWLIPPTPSLPQLRSCITSKWQNILIKQPSPQWGSGGLTGSWCNREVLEHRVVLPGQSKALFKSGPLYPTICNAH